MASVVRSRLGRVARPVLTRLGGVLLLSIAGAGLARSQSSGAPGALLVPGIYTEEQAGRGTGVFDRVCLECHTRKDMTSADFRLNWNGRTVFDLFDRIRTTMPEAAPGSLTLDEYAVVTAYLLKLNGMPAGTTPLAPDSTLVQVKLKLDSVPPPDAPTGAPRPSARGHDVRRPVHAVAATSHSRIARAVGAHRALAPLRRTSDGPDVGPSAGRSRGR